MVNPRGKALTCPGGKVGKRAVVNLENVPQEVTLNNASGGFLTL